jgi:hypothetical protein
MMREVRYLCFDKSDVEALLRLGARRTGRALPPGRLTCFRAEHHDFAFRFHQDHVLHLSPAQCFSFIFYYCQAQRVPIARGLDKRLEMQANHLILVLGAIAEAAPGARALPRLDAPPPCAACRTHDVPCRFAAAAAPGSDLASPAG